MVPEKVWVGLAQGEVGYAPAPPHKIELNSAGLLLVLFQTPMIIQLNALNFKKGLQIFWVKKIFGVERNYFDIPIFLFSSHDNCKYCKSTKHSVRAIGELCFKRRVMFLRHGLCSKKTDYVRATWLMCSMFTERRFFGALATCLCFK